MDVVSESHGLLYSQITKAMLADKNAKEKDEYEGAKMTAMTVAVTVRIRRKIKTELSAIVQSKRVMAMGWTPRCHTPTRS